MASEVKSTASEEEFRPILSSAKASAEEAEALRLAASQRLPSGTTHLVPRGFAQMRGPRGQSCPPKKPPPLPPPLVNVLQQLRSLLPRFLGPIPLQMCLHAHCPGLLEFDSLLPSKSPPGFRVAGRWLGFLGCLGGLLLFSWKPGARGHLGEMAGGTAVFLPDSRVALVGSFRHPPFFAPSLLRPNCSLFQGSRSAWPIPKLARLRFLQDKAREGCSCKRGMFWLQGDC